MSSSGPSSSGPGRPGGAVVLPPVVTQSSALNQLADMFPHLSRDTMLRELNRNDREMERTVMALLAYGDGAADSSHPVAAPAVESDEALARRMQADIDFESARAAAGSGWTGRSGGSGSGSGAGFGGSISEKELTRLKLAQFHHRESIYQANNEGEFAPKRSATGAGGARISQSDATGSLDHRSPGERQRERQGQSRRKSGAGVVPLSPLERIHRDLAQPDRNRVASAEELKVALSGPAALRKLHKKRSEEAAAVAAVQALGFEVRRPEAPQDPRLLAAAQANQAALAQQAASAAHWAESAAGAGAGAGAASSSSSYAAGASSLASPSVACSTPPRRAKDGEEGDGDGGSSSHKKKKKKKKEKEKDGDRDGGSSKKKKKKRDKEKTKAREASHAANAAPAPSSSASSSSSSPAAAAASAAASASSAASPRRDVGGARSAGPSSEWSVSRSGGGHAIDEAEVQALLS